MNPNANINSEFLKNIIRKNPRHILAEKRAQLREIGIVSASSNSSLKEDKSSTINSNQRAGVKISSDCGDQDISPHKTQEKKSKQEKSQTNSDSVLNYMDKIM